jgi:hypothetical protein
MQSLFTDLLELLEKPLPSGGGVKTDNSILLVYPPERELDFREYLLDRFFPLLQARQIPCHSLDLTGFLFGDLPEETIQDLQEDEFDDYQWLKQGLAKRVELALQQRIAALAGAAPGCTIVVYATVALYPLVRFGEILRGLRDVPCRTVLAFPGEERGGKLHFMNQVDGGNYLAVKLFWR